MTTIVANLTKMVSDTQVTDEDGYLSSGDKIFRAKGHLIGISGVYAQGLLFVAWYKDRRRKKPDISEANIIVLSDKGMFTYEYEQGELIRYPVKEPFYAVGTGSAYAIGAVLNGASLTEAVKISCKCDSSSALPIKEAYLHEGQC